MRNPDGSLRVVGFDPIDRLLRELRWRHFGHMFGARWRTTTGARAIATDPAWTRCSRWQKELVDWYGHDDLAAFHAAARATSSRPTTPSRPGRWRCASTASGASRSSRSRPPDARLRDRAAAGRRGPTGAVRLGLHQRQRHRHPGRRPAIAEASWKLVKYLATDDGGAGQAVERPAQRALDRASLRSPDLVPDDRFAVFLDIFGHERSAIGADDADRLGVPGHARRASAMRWQAGEVEDLDRR